MNVIEANRQRELWFTDGKNCYFFPQGWCDDFTVAAGFTGGPDYIDEDTEEPSPEIYGYAPVYVEANSEVETMFIPVADLEKMREIDEIEARQIHPKLGEYLDEINNGL